MTMDPFGALGLPVRADLTDDDVRVAWRRIAAATHPDRADGGDPDRFAAASAAYTELRTRSGRGEAYADLAAGTRSRAPAQTQPIQTQPTRPAEPSPATPPADQTQAGQTQADQTQASQTQASQTQPGHTQHGPLGNSRLARRFTQGRPVLLAVRLAIAVAVSVAAFAVTGAQPAAIGLAIGALTWFLLTARHDLAPPDG